jgi:prolyl-tRNA synthetase
VLQSTLFPKTRKESPKGAEVVSHKLLVRAGFVDQLMAGSWTLLPLGWRVVDRINQIIREEMNATGAQEILMPLLHPKEIWNETGRWETAKEVMYQFENERGKEFALSFTHEEIVLDLVRKQLRTYKDLPIALYHFSTKFRNELRVRGGILRGREFLMKDLYSVHDTEKDFWRYYNEVKDAYSKVFKRLGFDFKITEAPGGVFTKNRTHEFQVLSEGGEDTIYYCDECDWGENKEIYKGKAGVKCPRCKKGKVIESRAIEVGNIFPFGTYYSEKMNVTFADKSGKKKHPYFGSYGIGSTRVMGTLVEVSHDDKGIIWYPQVAPFEVQLIEISDHGSRITDHAKKVYKKLSDTNIEVLWDDRDVAAGEKFADADLIGIPVRLVVSDKTGDKVEWKNRAEKKTELMSLDEVIKKLSSY